MSADTGAVPHGGRADRAHGPQPVVRCRQFVLVAGDLGCQATPQLCPEPPHHHDQPEIYHYRFTHPDGYGHAELGDDVLKVRAHDTVLIPPGLDHAQVSAPGYGMYYLWMIRHLPGNPYTGFTFAEEHKWTLDPAQQGWLPPAVA